MDGNDRRPVFLSLHKIRLPINGLVSIFHRVSGLVMCLTLPIVLCALSCSLKSAAHFAQVKASLLQPQGWGLVCFLIALAWIYHVLAGMRHLIMDIGWGKSLSASRCMAFCVLLLFTASAVSLGVWLW